MNTFTVEITNMRSRMRNTEEPHTRTKGRPALPDPE